MHVQTHPIAASALLANADTAAIAYYGQEAWDQERVSTCIALLSSQIPSLSVLLYYSQVLTGITTGRGTPRVLLLL